MLYDRDIVGKHLAPKSALCMHCVTLTTVIIFFSVEDFGRFSGQEVPRILRASPFAVQLRWALLTIPNVLFKMHLRNITAGSATFYIHSWHSAIHGKDDWTCVDDICSDAQAPCVPSFAFRLLVQYVVPARKPVVALAVATSAKTNMNADRFD